MLLDKAPCAEPPRGLLRARAAVLYGQAAERLLPTPCEPAAADAGEHPALPPLVTPTVRPTSASGALSPQPPASLWAPRPA